MPLDLIVDIVIEARNMGFDQTVCLSHANEPLMDPRLPDIARLVKKIGRFRKVICFSNGELLTPDLAKELDGAFDAIHFALYYDAEKREQEIRALFKTTKPVFVDPVHIATHYSPKFDVEALAAEYIDNPCYEPQIRIIFNYKGELLFCCEEVASNFDLGSYPEKSIKELWFGEKYQSLVKTLRYRGGRRALPYCSTCPRKGQE